ncbi:MAG: porin [Xanthobacteraceae bacterium]
MKVQKRTAGSVVLAAIAFLLGEVAQAADLPVKAKAVEYVKICSLYGAGFYYIPGTDTCIKLGGYLRVDVLANANAVNTGNVFGLGGAQNRYTNGFTWRSREDFSIDTRTQTEYGVVRTLSFVTFTWTSGGYFGNGNGSTSYDAASLGTSGNGAVGGGQLGTFPTFIQFAGFTLGKAISQFSMPWVNYPGNTFDGLVGGGGSVTGVNQFTYSANLGGGNTLTLSAQDPVAYYQAGVQNLGALGGGGALGIFGGSNYGGSASPDFIATFRADRPWGMFKLSAAAHDNHAAYFGGTEPTGHPKDLWGYAVAAGLTIKNVPAEGDSINVQGVYTNGATRYNIQDLAGQYGAVGLFGKSSNPLAYQGVAINSAPDTVFVTGSDQHAIKTWGAQGAYNHNWNANWNSSFYGAWASVRYDNFSKVAICGTAGNGGASGGTFLPVFSLTGVAGGGTCNPDYQIVQAGFVTRWTPVKGVAISADITWSHIQQKNSGLVVAASGALGKPAAFYELKNQDNVLLLIRAQRNW